MCWQFGFELAVHIKLQQTIICHLTYFRAREIPFFEDFQNEILFPFLYYHQHALLTFAQQQFPCLHIFLPRRNFIKVNRHPHFALRAHL